MMLSWEQSTEPRDRHRTVLAPRSATLNTSIHRRQTLYRRGLRYIDERSHLLHISHIMITPYRPKPVFFSVLFKPISAMCKTVSNASCVMQNSWTDRRPVCGEDFWGHKTAVQNPYGDGKEIGEILHIVKRERYSVRSLSNYFGHLVQRRNFLDPICGPHRMRWWVIYWRWWL